MGTVAETGTLTYLFTDVSGSTRLWEQAPAAMAAAMALHDRTVEDAVAAHAGRVVRPRGEGDSRFAVFARAADALAAARAVQAALAATAWPTARPIRVRLAVHTGESAQRESEFYGEAVNRCARLRGIAHPGQSLASAAAAASARDGGLPDGIGLVDLGVHRLPDLSRPEHVFQIEDSQAPQAFPPLLSIDRARHNLPVRLSALVGRDDELALLQKLLPARRLVTVTGFGGVGKTRLALQAAAEAADGSGDGVWFVDLAATPDAEHAAAEIAATLGAAEQSDGPRAATLRALAGRRLLLLLDNLEQIPDAADLVATILDGAPEVTVLATSRRPLGITGEQEFPLGALDTDHVTGSAVRLFADRAADGNPGFDLTPPVAEAVLAVCRRLEGHPLSIELAAARTRVLAPRALLERLDGVLSILASGTSNRPERHRTLRATIAWSYDLLGADERLLLDCLSVFPGPMALDAVEQVCGPELAAGSLLGALTGLVENSLLEREGDGRFRLLVSVRAFASERLADRGLTDRLADRHADHYAWFQREQPDRAAGVIVAEFALWSRDLHNLRQAHERLRHRPDPAEEAAIVVGNFPDTLMRHGHFAELVGICTLLLARDGVPPAAAARARTCLTLVHVVLGRLGEARAEITLGRAAAQRAGRPDLDAHLCTLGVDVAPDDASTLAAVRELELAVAAVPPSGNWLPRWNIDYLASLATVTALRFLDPPAALEAARRYARPDRDAGFGLHTGALYLGQLLLDIGRTAEAARALEPAAASAGVVTGTGPYIDLRSCLEVSRLKVALGDLPAAEEYAALAVDRGRSMGIPGWVAWGLAQQADIACAAGNLEGAERLLAEALAAAPAGYRVGEAAWRLARVRRLRGAPDPGVLALAARSLAGEQRRALPDLLACLVEQAYAAESPSAAADLAGLVLAHRGPFVLPAGADAELPPLLDRLRAGLGRELDDRLAGARARPLPAAN